jgi:hypothetical protein
MKIVINDGIGIYGLSEKAYKFLGLDWQNLVVAPMERQQPGISREISLIGFAYFDSRTDTKLVECVEVLGLDAGWEGSHLVVVNVDTNREWVIERDDYGWERIKYLDEFSVE